jgi:hypothetical protein
LGFTSLEDYCDPLYLWVINHQSDTPKEETRCPTQQVLSTE